MLGRKHETDALNRSAGALPVSISQTVVLFRLVALLGSGVMEDAQRHGWLLESILSTRQSLKLRRFEPTWLQSRLGGNVAPFEVALSHHQSIRVSLRRNHGRSSIAPKVASGHRTE